MFRSLYGQSMNLTCSFRVEGPNKKACHACCLLKVATKNRGCDPTHAIHVWYIYLHLVDFYGKCREVYHTWMLWAMFKIIILDLLVLTDANGTSSIQLCSISQMVGLFNGDEFHGIRIRKKSPTMAQHIQVISVFCSSPDIYTFDPVIPFTVILHFYPPQSSLRSCEGITKQYYTNDSS